MRELLKEIAPELKRFARRSTRLLLEPFDQVPEGTLRK
jgi:hypothetical protein